MKIFIIILQFEWRLFLRQPAQLLLLFFFVVLGIYSLKNGYDSVQKQIVALDNLKQNQNNHLKDITDRFLQDTTTELGKKMAAQAGLPQVIEFRYPPYATFPPSQLSIMATGQRDIMPYYDIVTSKRDIFSPSTAEIVNPEKLASGNFDLSFVLIYLFPLLIIILGYDVLSKENEQQTRSILTVQSVNIKKIIFYKMVFRFLIVFGLGCFLSFAGFYLFHIPAQIVLHDILLWISAMLIYIIFWFSLTWLVVLYNRNSMSNLLYLTGTWLTLSLLLPAITNKIAQVVYPLPLRTTLIMQQREVIEKTWKMPVGTLLDSFYQNNTQYYKLKKLADTATYGNKRFVAYYDLLGRRMDKNVNDYSFAAYRHNSFIKITAIVNPVAQAQILLNAAAQTGQKDYLHYQKEVSHFQNRWVKLMNSYLLYDKKLSLVEVRHLPRFHLSPDDQKWRAILLQCLYMAVITVVILFIAHKKKV